MAGAFSCTENHPFGLVHPGGLGLGRFPLTQAVGTSHQTSASIGLRRRGTVVLDVVGQKTWATTVAEPFGNPSETLRYPMEGASIIRVRAAVEGFFGAAHSSLP